MDKKIKSPLTGKRRLVQLYAALLYNANLKGFLDGHIYTGPLKAACVPGFNCYSCPGAIASCPLGALQNALNAAGHTAPWYILGILALFGVILGRAICGWACPVGLLQELLHKIPTPKVRKSRVTRILSYAKYGFLVFFVILIPLWYGVSRGAILPAFCKYICPVGTLEGAVGILQHPNNSTSFYQLGQIFTQKWIIMLAIGLACVFCYRSFCRFICPLGAIYGFFNRFSLAEIRVNMDQCISCGKCIRTCQMDVKQIGDHECIACGRCISACSQGAISLNCGKITLIGPALKAGSTSQAAADKRRKNSRILWAVALSVLLSALVWFNFAQPFVEPDSPLEANSQSDLHAKETLAEGTGPITDEEPVQAAPHAAPAAAGENGQDSSVPSRVPGDENLDDTNSPAVDYSSALPIGTQIGCQLPDFSTELINGNIFQLSAYRGHVVIINFWATTCAPCIEELPYYELLKAAHPDLEILAIHNRAGAKKAQAFLADKGWDHLDFALDSKEKGLFTLLHASDAMPQTIVLNRRGEVTYNAQAPLTLEKLEILYKNAYEE